MAFKVQTLDERTGWVTQHETSDKAMALMVYEGFISHRWPPRTRVIEVTPRHLRPIDAHAELLRQKRRRRMLSGGMLAESRDQRYRVYDNHDGTFGASVYDGMLFVPIERRSNGLPKRYRSRRKAVRVVETDQRKGR